MRICPHLGLKSDPSTALHFASVGNYCHHVQPIEVVREPHQMAFCLVGEHVNCPVFQLAAGSRMPRKFRANAAAREKKKLQIATLPAVILLVLLVSAAFIFLQLTTPGGLFNAGGPTLSSTPDGSLVAIPTQTARPTQDAFRPFCQPPLTWHPYIVAETDNFATLSLTYGRPMEQLMTANCRTSALDLTPGETIYLPDLPTATSTVTSTVTQTPTRTLRIIRTRPPNLLPTWTGTYVIIPFTDTPTPTNTPVPSNTPAPSAPIDTPPPLPT
jgi:hypothetical protein